MPDKVLLVQVAINNTTIHLAATLSVLVGNLYFINYNKNFPLHIDHMVIITIILENNDSFQIHRYKLR